jgi:hypothetical protein
MKPPASLEGLKGRADLRFRALDLGRPGAFGAEAVGGAGGIGAPTRHPPEVVE